MTFTRGEVAAYYLNRIPKLNWNGRREVRCPCPVHHGKDENFTINTETGLAQCHSQCGRGWDLISLEQELSGTSFPLAKSKVFQIVGRPEVPWEERDVEAFYDYTDENGKVQYQVLRKYGKKFMQRQPDGMGGWKWGLSGRHPVPYRLPKLIAAKMVFVVEGEKDVHTLEALGLTATCNNGGAENFSPDLVKWFSSKQVCIVPDNDDPGRRYALHVAALIAPVAVCVKIIEIPNLPEKGDVTDFVNSGGTIEQIREFYRKAQAWTPEWEFSSQVPNGNDKFLHTFSGEIESAGGLEEFWALWRMTGHPTPWLKLTRALGGGMRNGEIYVLGANQGAGKTSIILQFVIHLLPLHVVPLMFSMEMNARTVFQRMASIRAQVNLNALRDAQIDFKKATDPVAKEAAKATVNRLGVMLARATSELSQYPLIVSTRAGITPEYIVQETARLQKRDRVNFVIIDHMQLMSADSDVQRDYEKFTAISRAMKQVAVELNVPVMIASQTSRKNSTQHRDELDVSDLRGSGAIEEDAAAVMLLYEDGDDRKKTLANHTYSEGPVKTWLKIGKNRYGKQGCYIELRHLKNCTRFDLPEDV